MTLSVPASVIFPSDTNSCSHDTATHAPFLRCLIVVAAAHEHQFFPSTTTMPSVAANIVAAAHDAATSVLDHRSSPLTTTLSVAVNIVAADRSSLLMTMPSVAANIVAA
eukprot:CAMPEP_0171423276 /NCGR_PEP_ID=MMETSP0881-20121228/1874_1 /TAXON_ID=67004 /ORGANISM="Thalassiosira weissflogii, Strain CCMP1336" /LENGTH=108 /DNA_ID=CAMNT_0011942137 /DNA_START=116 /DNA_END=439 /DNA_ORIENTATION=+